jgi:SHS2 domain-containing protein
MTGLAGHRSVPHTADLRIEAWARTREECLAEAVLALVGSVVDRSAAAPAGRWEQDVRAASDEDLLAAVLDEVIFRMDTTGQVPLGVSVGPIPGGVRLACTVADGAALPLVGAVPKAVALHSLRLVPGSRGWECTATVDV